MASSTTTTHDQLHHYATTAAPPPTPSSQPSTTTSSSAAAADTLSRLLLRLPPALSLPTRRPSPPSCTTTPSTISLSDPTHILQHNLLSASQLGFFQLTQHSLPSQLAHSAESDSLSLLTHQNNLHFPQNWPLGFDDDNDENRVNSFCFDSAISAESLPLKSLRKFTLEMEKVGLEIVEAMAGAVGFENPARDNPTRICSLMWVTDGLAGSNKLYPYVVGLQYQIRQQKCTLSSDSGLVSVLPEVDSILVTLGDIAQVWSNGKLRKIIGRPMPNLEEGHITMTLLVTLPLDSIVSPLVPKLNNGNDNDDEEDNSEDDNKNEHIVENSRLFNSFSFEDYAWSVYHERILLKDPLERYRSS